MKTIVMCLAILLVFATALIKGASSEPSLENIVIEQQTTMYADSIAFYENQCTALQDKLTLTVDNLDREIIMNEVALELNQQRLDSLDYYLALDAKERPGWFQRIVQKVFPNE